MDKLLSLLQGSADAVWSSLSRITIERTPARILFVGVEPRVGTTGIAAATALGLARNLRIEVGLVETNIENPTLANLLGLNSSVGLSDILDGRAKLEECVRSIALMGSPDVHVLPAGSPRTPFPGEFATTAASAVFDEFMQRGSYLLIDAPPILSHPETRYLLRYADGVVLVLRAGHTSRGEAEKAIQIFEDSRVPVLGTVLNRFKSEKLSLSIKGHKIF